MSNNTNKLVQVLGRIAQNTVVAEHIKARIYRQITHQSFNYYLWKKMIVVIASMVTLATAYIVVIPMASASYIGKLSANSGDVLIKNAQETIRVADGEVIRIQTGDEIMVGSKSRASIVFIDDSMVVMSEDTVLKIQDVNINGQDLKKSGITVDLKRGKIFSSVNKIANKNISNFKVKTKKAIIEAYKSNFNIEVKHKIIKVQPLTEGLLIKPLNNDYNESNTQLNEGEFAKIIDSNDKSVIADINGNIVDMSVKKHYLSSDEIANNFVVAESKILDVIPYLNNNNRDKLNITLRNYQRFMAILAKGNKDGTSLVNSDARTLVEITAQSYWQKIIDNNKNLDQTSILFAQNIMHLEQIVFTQIRKMSKNSLAVVPAWEDNPAYNDLSLYLAKHIIILSHKVDKKDSIILANIADLPLQHFWNRSVKNLNKKAQKQKLAESIVNLGGDSADSELAAKLILISGIK